VLADRQAAIERGRLRYVADPRHRPGPVCVNTFHTPTRAHAREVLNLWNTTERTVYAAIARIGGNAADTLGNDMLLLGLRLRRV